MVDWIAAQLHTTNHLYPHWRDFLVVALIVAFAEGRALLRASHPVTALGNTLILAAGGLIGSILAGMFDLHGGIITQVFIVSSVFGGQCMSYAVILALYRKWDFALGNLAAILAILLVLHFRASLLAYPKLDVVVAMGPFSCRGAALYGWLALNFIVSSMIVFDAVRLRSSFLLHKSLAVVGAFLAAGLVFGASYILKLFL